MSLDFASPRALWLLAVLPLLWWIGQAGVRQRPRLWSTIARGALLACLIAALAQPGLMRRASRTTRIYLVDASQSVSTRALDSVAGAIDGMNAEAPVEASRILTFGGGVAAIADTAALRRLAAGQASIDSSMIPEATNVEQALAAARAEILPAGDGQVVLFSDGHETEGDGGRGAERSGVAGVPVFTYPMPVRDLADTWLEAIRTSHPPVAGAVSRLELVVGSQVAGGAEVVVREGTRTLGQVRAAVAPGSVTIPMDVTFDTPGAHLVEAVVAAEHDVLAENNALSREVVVEPRLRVLYVHTAGNDAGVAARALSGSGVVVTTVRPAALPRDPAVFDAWDVVVLSNVGRVDLAPEVMRALAAWVEQRGGGLLFVGGNAVYGEGLDPAHQGYRYSELERVLPVTFDRQDEPNVALVIVLDRSWSMKGAAMDLSKTAAEGAATALDSSQMLGVLTFNNAWNWDVELGRVRDRRLEIQQAIERITASGPTAIYPALEEAYGALARVRARAKHVILLSDGQSDPQDFERLARRMSAARITVSTVALGPDADVPLLRSVATWGGGRSYVVPDAAQIPEIFVKEAKNAATPGEKGGEAAAAAAPAASRQTLPFFDGPVQVPAIADHDTVTRKPQAIQWLATGSDPLLTVWPAGLGRTAMFAADLDGRWTADWLRWPRLAGFLGGVVRSLAPRRTPPWSLTVTPGARRGAQAQVTIALETSERSGGEGVAVPATVEVTSGAGPVGRVALPQLGPGRYETTLVTDVSQPVTFAAAGPPGAADASRILALDPAGEYRFGVPDQDRLTAIARASGGSWRPSTEELRRRPHQPGRSRYPLFPWLVALALLLWPVDIALRRFQR